MVLKISAAQRDALYDEVLDRLGGIGDIAVAIDAESYEIAERLGRSFPTTWRSCSTTWALATAMGARSADLPAGGLAPGPTPPERTGESAFGISR